MAKNGAVIWLFRKKPGKNAKADLQNGLKLWPFQEKALPKTAKEFRHQLSSSFAFAKFIHKTTKV